jgi:hypothetical protein
VRGGDASIGGVWARVSPASSRERVVGSEQRRCRVVRVVSLLSRVGFPLGRGPEECVVKACASLVRGRVGVREAEFACGVCGFAGGTVGLGLRGQF